MAKKLKSKYVVGGLVVAGALLAFVYLKNKNAIQVYGVDPRSPYCRSHPSDANCHPKCPKGWMYDLRMQQCRNMSKPPSGKYKPNDPCSEVGSFRLPQCQPKQTDPLGRQTAHFMAKGYTCGGGIFRRCNHAPFATFAELRSHRMKTGHWR